MFKGPRRQTHHVLSAVWLCLLVDFPPKGLGYFLGETKAVLNGCEDHWTLQASMPLLFQMTVCVDIHVVVPGAWVAFSYSSVHAPRPELGLEGDGEALYGWLLRVRHTFPVRLTLQRWHRVCLKRDVLHNSFSLEVDGQTVSERTVIAQAIPPSGSLRLGCRPRDRPPGAALGQVELYLFRMWADLEEHGQCEDGTVVGWNAQFWGLTSPKARQRDADLQCAFAAVVGRIFTAQTSRSSTTTLSPVKETRVTDMSRRTSRLSDSSLINCDISQLCSDKDAYFWMSIIVEVEGSSKTERDVHDLVARAFSCHSPAASVGLCQEDRELQVLHLICEAKHKIRNTSCAALLRLSRALPACELQLAGLSALQQAGDGHMQVRIRGDVERVGWNLCGDVAPSSGRFVRCTSESSLDEVCRENKLSQLTCSITELSASPNPRPESQTCSREAHRFCDCSVFCNSASQFFGTTVNINGASDSVTRLNSLFHKCLSGSVSLCPDLLEQHKQLHLRCHNVTRGLYSCTVVLEMSASVDSCVLDKLLQRLIDGDDAITNASPFRRMGVCGPPGLSLPTLLQSHLTWATGELQTSDICQPDNTLIECEAHEKIAVPLTDGCTPTAWHSTTRPSTATKSVTPPATETSGPSERTDRTAETTAAVQWTDVSLGTARPLTAMITTQSRNTMTPTESPKPQNTTTVHQSMTLSPVNSTSRITTTGDTTAPPPGVMTVFDVTTAEAFTPSPEDTKGYNVTTATTGSASHTTDYNETTFSSHQNSTITTKNTTVRTITLTPNDTVLYDVTTDADILRTENIVTTADNNRDNDTIAKNAAMSTIIPSPSANNYTTESNLTTVTSHVNTVQNNVTTEYNTTTVEHNSSLHNSKLTTINATLSTFTPSPNHTTTDSVSVATDNYATRYGLTADNNRTHHNTSMANHLPPPYYNTTTVNTFTLNSNQTAVHNVTTVTDNCTRASSNDTAVNNIAGTLSNINNGTTTSKAAINTFTPSPRYMNNTTTVSKSYTTAENTVMDTATTSTVRRTQQNATISANANEADTPATFTKNSTVDIMTSVVENATQPTDSQTGNHSTALTHNVTATSPNYTTSTTAADGVIPSVNQSEAEGPHTNWIFSPSSSPDDFSVTSEAPEDKNTSVGDLTRASTTILTTTTHINTTTAAVPSTSPTTTRGTVTSSSTTKPGTGSTGPPTAATTRGQEAWEQQALELLDQTQDPSGLNSSQVTQLAGHLEKLLDGPTVSPAAGQMAVNIISNLMEGDALALSASASRLIRVVEDLGVKLVLAGDIEIVSSNSLVLAVRKVDATNFPPTYVDIFNTDNVQIRNLSRSWSKRSESAVGSVFLPSSLIMGLSPEQQQQASRVQFTYYTKSALFQDASIDNQTVVSAVLGSSVANLSISNLTENIQFTIRNINATHADYGASCAFWDFTLNGGGGGWSSAGCFLVNATSEATTCSCNHLTSFAVLLDLSRQGITDHQQAQILTFITNIGCGISAVFLAATLLTYLSFEKLLRDIPAKILVQLCVSLLLLNLVFLLDGWLAMYPATGLCTSTAFFLHYFLLTSFTWAGLEALHMYLSVVQVFTPYLSRYMLKLSLMGWGLPLLVVIVVISVDKDNYGLVSYAKHTDGTSDKFCWLRNDITFYAGVVAYFTLVFALCLLVFILVMVQLARIKKQNPQNQSPDRGVLTDLRSVTGLAILLGLTWGFALFAWGPLRLPFTYLFSIFNSLQGFLVFVFHCAVKENVRRQWRTHLCCGSLRLAENSEWSRTASRSNRNMAATTASTSALHFTSRSSSVISDGTSSSGSVFADSGISDYCSNDVILNEIHRHNLSL